MCTLYTLPKDGTATVHNISAPVFLEGAILQLKKYIERSSDQQETNYMLLNKPTFLKGMFKLF